MQCIFPQDFNFFLNCYVKYFSFKNWHGEKKQNKTNPSSKYFLGERINNYYVPIIFPMKMYMRLSSQKKNICGLTLIRFFLNNPLAFLDY